MNHISGQITLQEGSLNDISCGTFSYENLRIVIRMLGHLNGMTDTADLGPLISDLFLSYDIDITSHLKGLYLLMIYDKVKHSLHFFHGLSTYILSMYYTVNNGILYYSTSLRSLLVRSQVPRKFDEDGLRNLVANGYVTGCKTIVENVNKLEPFKSLLVGNNAVKQVPVQYAVQSFDENDAKELWKPVLDQAILQCVAGNDEINLTLSSGYDSNYILHVSSQKVKVPINAFSVGGASGQNELPYVNKIVTYYDNINLRTAYTNSNSLQCLPDIVWRLEGSVYERGIFLQYELARLLDKAQKTSLICGECADQVMNMWYLDRERIEGCGIDTIYSNKFRSNLTNKPFPYLYGNLLVLKKNGIMSNSFDIDTRYPYLSDDFIAVASALRNLNGTNKQFHIDTCKETLNPDVINNLAKKGGATDVRSLFESDSEIGHFISRVKRTDFYKSNSRLLHSISYFSLSESVLRPALAILPGFIDISKTHFGIELSRRTEITLRQTLCFAYLAVFNNLILSGEYDYLFDCNGVDISLDDILN